MLDQSFTAENFRKIFDYENRKGVYLEGKFFPDVEKVTQEIKKSTTKIRNLKKKKETLSTEDYEAEKNQLNDEKKKLKDKKEQLLKKELEKISTEISDGNFQLTLEQVSTPSGKPAFKSQDDPHAYFVLKQIQYNISKLYKVRQSNRYEILCQFKSILNDPFPKHVIRTDIESFYETIPRDKLLKKIDEEPLLTLSSKKLIRQVLKKYQDLTGSTIGIPRGIGISAYLSELYMREFDKSIKRHPEVIFYARYVDDIVIVFAPKPNSDSGSYLPFVTQHAQNLSLTLNATKTTEHDVLQPKKWEIEYLGYKIRFGDGAIEFDLSDKKKQKYKCRIKDSFDEYKKQQALNEKKARKILIKRIRFLANNTRLHNNKGNVLIGIYYSNSLLSNSNFLQCLDDCLQTQISGLTIDSLKDRLKKNSFQNGFARKHFIPFKVKDLSSIVRLWKYEA